MAVDKAPTPGGTSHVDRDATDLVGDELGDNARIWHEYDRVAREDDRERIGNWNRGLDNLALFAGLLSAVTTTLIVESHHDTEPDYARLTFLVLNATATGIPLAEEPFVIDHSVRVLNALWFSSLMLSLTAALIAIMGKDWIGMYCTRPVCNPRQWAEIRTYRLTCVNRWYMPGVIACAPVLLHMSLLLFSTGLVMFASPDPVLQRVALALAVAMGVLYLITMLSAVIFPASPFKSPATLAFRDSARTLFISSRDLLCHYTVPSITKLVQRTGFAIGSVLSHPVFTAITPTGRPDRRRGWLQRVSAVWGHLFVADAAHHQSLAATFQHVSMAAYKYAVRMICSMLSSMRSAFAQYRYQRQRPHTKPWYHSALEQYRYNRQCPRTRPWYHHICIYLLQLQESLLLVEPWTDVHSMPKPELLAESLSLLHTMSQAPDVFQSILIALGDIVIGGKVGLLVSEDLRSRLNTEIQRKWRRAELNVLSRYILADQNLSTTPWLTWATVHKEHFPWGTERSMRSEDLIFALIRLCMRGSFFPGIHAEDLYRHFPASPVQPRALQSLLPLLEHPRRGIMIILILADRYWEHLKDDNSFNLEKELRLRHGASVEAKYKSQCTHLFGGRSGLVELLVSYILDHNLPDAVFDSVRNLILKVISDERQEVRHHSLAYALGSGDQRISNCAWPGSKMARAQLGTNLLAPYQYLSDHNRSLVLENRSNFDVCLSRTIIRLISPSWSFYDSGWGFSIETALDTCIRCIHDMLCLDGSTLTSDMKDEIIKLMLEKSALACMCPPPDDYTCDNTILSILSAVSHHLTGLIGQERTSAIGRSLFCLFSFSEAQSEKGELVTWSLGRYLCNVLSWCSLGEHRNLMVKAQNFVAVLQQLRPLCEPHADICAAWNCINKELRNAYHDPSLDARLFDLGPLIAPEIPDKYTMVEYTSAGGLFCDALHLLDVSMH